MRWLGFVVLSTLLVACSGGDGGKSDATGEDDQKEFTYKTFASRFTEGKLPFQIADTSLEGRGDTSTLRNPEFQKFLPDSLRRALFGNGRVKFSPVVRLNGGDEGSYFIVRASVADRRAALLYIFDKKEQFRTVFPFLTIDQDPATNQYSTLDRQGGLTRTITKKMPKELLAEGKETYVYTAETNSFTLIGIDPLEDRRDVLNPIDTLARKHPLAGDYVKDQHNFVSVRDARNPNEVQFFIHFEKSINDDEKCAGELKGTALLTSSTTAVYRQGGDPCVLELQFGTNSVTLRESEGCGSHRDVKCVFEGSYPRKKVVSPKTTKAKKPKR